MGDIEIVKFLVSHGADINAKNNDDITPLDCAEDEYVIEFLKSIGAKSGKE